MRSLSLKLALLAFGLLLVSCAQPDLAATASTTAESADRSTSTIPATLGPATTSIVITTTVAPTTSTTVVAVEGSEPEIDLKPPGFHEVIPLDEIDDYFIFGYDISPSHTTRYSEKADGEEWSLTAHVDDGLTHYVGTGMMDGEMMMDEGDVWVRNEKGVWVVDEETFELPPFIFFPSPDIAYGLAYKAFDAMEFVEWIEVDGQRIAVYRGGPEAAALATDDELDAGSLDAWWSPAGYFPMVSISQEHPTGTVEATWEVTDAGATRVEPPPA